VCAAAFVWFWSRHSDRTGERVGHTSGAMLLGAIGMVASGFLIQSSPVLALAAICVAAMGIFAAISPFWELPAAALAGAAAASGIALINSLGNLGGFASPYAVGVLVDKTGDSKSGLLMLAAVLFITATATFLYGRKIHAGQVPTGSHEDLLAKEVAAFDLAAEELHHRGDPDIPPTTPREKTP
jgi:ACS family tartrate transporter-like MFS transporter